jgi:glycosyltransferase involved in cell wall biosynthesis
MRTIITPMRLELLRRSGVHDVLILDSFVTMAMPPAGHARHIVVIHDLDWSATTKRWRRGIFTALKPLVHHNLRLADFVVTVSKYWEARLRGLGCARVQTIYNGFREADFVIRDDEVASFRRRFGWTKPVVYIGNHHPGKGILQSYEALKGLDVHLVTSGKWLANVPPINLELSYRDYLCLLRASSVIVTMSLFHEGWCRTAHEAMLLERPVVGSGFGGMGELLRGGSQIVCSRFEDLRSHVEALLAEPERRGRMGEEAHRFARTFTEDRMRSDWVRLLSSLDSSQQ